MATLYEIDEEILNCVDQETGEIIDPEKLAQLMQKQSKQRKTNWLTARKHVKTRREI